MINHPLEWYIDKLKNAEPICSLLFGDGELQVAFRERTGVRFTFYRELITSNLEQEMFDSLQCQDSRMVKGTDEQLLSIYAEGLKQVPATEWVDGTVWDVASREGKLGPLLRVLKDRRCVVVGNQTMRKVAADLHCWQFIEIPANDAWASANRTSAALADAAAPTNTIFVLLCGLGAIPLIMRTMRLWPGAAFLDLGSTFDMFVGTGAERGWRRELYRDPAKLKETIRLNWEGVA